MADQERDYDDFDLRHSEEIGEKNQYGATDFQEETAAEIAGPVSFDRGKVTDDVRDLDTDFQEETAAEIAAPVSFDRGKVTDDVRDSDTDFQEETAAEIAAPLSFDRGRGTDEERDTATEGRGVGYAALALSIISLFVLPILFGATGIVLGFIARRRGATTLGSWAIGIGVVSIIVGMFILPFF